MLITSELQLSNRRVRNYHDFPISQAKAYLKKVMFGVRDWL